MGNFEMKKLLFYLALGIFFLLVLDTTRTYLLFRKSKSLVEKSIPFERINEKAEQKILVLGDSTAVGTGVEEPSLSTAGRLSALYPDAEVRNLAQNGMRVKGLVSVIEELKPEDQFSLILVQIGANDIIRLTSLKDIESDAEKILSQLREHSSTVLILHSGNVGEALFFPRYFRPLLSRRSLEVREIYQKLSNTHGATYVDLIDSEIGTLLTEHPSKYYAADYLHLSDEGYGLWFSEIQKSLTNKPI